MLVLLRIISTLALLYCINQARMNARNDPMGGDMTNAFWLAGGVLVAIACAATWAPLLGEKVADPLTGGLVKTPYFESKNRLIKLIRWCDARGHRRWVVFLCFLEGIRAPWLPGGFIIGMKAAQEGSWLQKVYAREVFNFNNAENCITAYRILKRHGIDPRPHKNTEINLVLLSEEQTKKPDAEILKMTQTAQLQKPQRDARIKIGGGK